MSLTVNVGRADPLTQKIRPDQRDHLVQFYETPEFLYSAVSRFVGKGLADRDAIVVIATPGHRQGFARELAAQGFDVAAAETSGQLTLLDAAETLVKFMVDGLPDRQRFRKTIGGLIQKIRRRYPTVRAYGEMVDLLFAANNLQGTIALEELWNELAKTYSFTLLCGYRMGAFNDEAQDKAFHQVCHTHTHVIPAQDFDYAEREDAESQRRTIAALQQQARVLQTEIAERKKTEKALQVAFRQLATERARFEAVLQQMPAGVAIVDAPSGDLILANDQVEQIFGEGVITDYDALKGFDASGRRYAAHEWPLARALANGEVVTAEEIDIVRGDGCRGTLAVSAAPIRDGEGKIVAGVSTFADITERKRAQRELVKATKLESVGLLAAGIAHDFNNILTAILGNISLAKLLNSGEPAINESLSQAEQASLRARDLTQQLLTFSKGGAPIRKLGSIADFLRESAPFAVRGFDVRLVLDIAPNLWLAKFDAGQMNQVIDNLLINATQAMPKGGTVTVAARNEHLGPTNQYRLTPNRYIEITVRDEGVGIAPETIDRIFDPYFTTKSTGTGLGLATSYSVIKRHDGYIGVSSQSGVGTTFTILLPAHTGNLATPSSVDSTAVHIGQGRVLLMDDESSVRDIGAALLKQLGYDAAVAADGAEALALYRDALQRQERFDAVIVDLTVPDGMGGLECMQKLRALDPQAQVIVSSGYSTDPVMADFAGFDFAGVIAKPYRVQDFSESIARVLKTSGPLC